MDTSKSELLCPRHKHKLVWLPSGHRYYCRGCKDQGLNGRYLCRHPDCADSDSDFDFDFVLHRECAQLPDVYQKPNLAAEELYFHSQTRFRNNCSACKKPIRGWFLHRPRWRRSPFMLKPSLKFHPLCLTLPKELMFTKHTDHLLKLVRFNDKSYICSFCAERCQGWRYECTLCRYTLDLTCAKLDTQGLLIHRKPPATLQGGNRIDNSNRTGNIVEGFASGFVGAVIAEILSDAVF